MEMRMPAAFIWRRLHSLMGLWLFLFLLEHLLINAQAASFLSENGQRFVHLVNQLHHLPYLRAVEIALIGTPLFVHMAWGVRYLFTASLNSWPSDGAKPYLNYERNHAFSWMRITAWIVAVGLLVHVVEFRFLKYPFVIKQKETTLYAVSLSADKSLYSLAKQLDVALYNPAEMRSGEVKDELSFFLERRAADRQHLVAVAKNFGTATLLTVRETFKNPFSLFFYSVFVLAAAFHAGHGFWTFLLTWGLVIKKVSQDRVYRFSLAVVVLLALLGLSAVWGAYWIRLGG